MADKTTSMLAYLNTRYGTSLRDLTTLLARYVAENPNGKAEKHKVFKEVVDAA